jgi:Tol biopolymer transport system component
MPARLPDGRVLLISDRGGRPAILLASPDGADAEPLLPPSSVDDSDPAPLGRDRILFSRAESAGGRDLYVVRIDGTGLVRLTRDPGDDATPCAMADGRTVVFVSDRDGTPRLYSLSPLSSDAESTVTPLFSPGGLPRSAVPGSLQDAEPADGAPACLPDGSIAFNRGQRGGPTHIYIASLASGRRGVRQVTDPLVLPHGAAEPVLLPNDRLLITGGPVPAGAGPRFAAYTITRGGYNLTRVTRGGSAYNDFARRLQPPR